MKHIVTWAVLAASALLAGCAAPSASVAENRAQFNDEKVAAAEAMQPKEQEEALTGSRIPRKTLSTDRSLKMVGNRDFRESNEVRSLGNTIHPDGQ